MGTHKQLQRCDSAGSPMGGSAPGSPTRKPGSSLHVANSAQSSPTKKRTPRSPQHVLRSPQHVLQRPRKVSLADDPDDIISCDTPSSHKIDSVTELHEKDPDDDHPTTDNNQNSIHNSATPCFYGGGAQHLIKENELERFPAGTLEPSEDETVSVQNLNSKHSQEGPVEGAWQDNIKQQRNANKPVSQRSFSQVAKSGVSLIYKSTVGACLHARASLKSIRLRSDDCVAQSQDKTVSSSDCPTAGTRPLIARKRYATVSGMRSEDLADVANEHSHQDEKGTPRADHQGKSSDGGLERRNFITYSSSNAPITHAPKKNPASCTASNDDYPVIICPKASPEADYENGAFTVNSGSEMITLVSTSEASWPAFPAVCCGSVVTKDLLTGASKESTGSPSSSRQKRCNIV